MHNSIIQWSSINLTDPQDHVLQTKYDVVSWLWCHLYMYWSIVIGLQLGLLSHSTARLNHCPFSLHGRPLCLLRDTTTTLPLPRNIYLPWELYPKEQIQQNDGRINGIQS